MTQPRASQPRKHSEEAGESVLPRHGVRLTVSYDGTGFCGWAEQPGQRTVAAEIARAAAHVSQHPVVVRGCSRTDAGVHALCQIVAFATQRELTPRRWVYALNRFLPPDIAVTGAELCQPDYQPRFDAKEKSYRYLFHLGAARSALLRDRAWHLGRYLRRHYAHRDRLEGSRPLLDLAAMREAAARLQGTHDFRAFRASADTRETTVRTLGRVSLREHHCGDPELLALEVTGNAFMKNMVRILAGTLIDVGRGRLNPDDVSALLGPQGDRRAAGPTAPAQGLTLVSVTLGRLRELASRSAR